MASGFVGRCPHGSEQGWGDGRFKAKAHVGWVPHSVAPAYFNQVAALNLHQRADNKHTQEFKKPLEFVANPVGENPGLPESQSAAVFKAGVGWGGVGCVCLTRMGAGFL